MSHGCNYLKNPFYDLNCVHMLQSVREEVDNKLKSPHLPFLGFCLPQAYFAVCP